MSFHNTHVVEQAKHAILEELRVFGAVAQD